MVIHENPQDRVKVREVINTQSETVEEIGKEINNEIDKEKIDITKQEESNKEGSSEADNNIVTEENDKVEDTVYDAELEELLADIYAKMKEENYGELYEKVKKFTVLDTPGMLDVYFYWSNEVNESLDSGNNALKAWGYWRSEDYENGYYAYFGSIKDSKPNGWGTKFRCRGLDSDDNGSKEYMVMQGKWVDGEPVGEFSVYHSDYTGNGEYAVTYRGNVKDKLWDGDITMMWENLSTGVSDFAIIHASNGTFPVIRHEGTKCVYAESNSGFYWSCDNAESLTKRGVYTW